MLERGMVYTKNKGDPFMVLGSTKKFVTIIYIVKGNLWESIPGLKIPGMGFARIEAVCTKNRSWEDKVQPMPVAKVSKQQFNQILNAVYAFLTYDIIEVEDGKFVYKDWEEEINDDSDNDVQESQQRDDEAHEEDTEECEKPQQEMSGVSEVSNLPENNGDLFVKYDDETDTPPEGYYDLLLNNNFKLADYENTRAEDVNANMGKKKSKRFFSEIEVIAIGCMNVKMVADKYNITYNQAAFLIRNAKDILGIDRTTFSKKYAYAKYFEEGLTAEEVQQIFPEASSSGIQHCYNRWRSNKNVTEESQREAIRRWKVPVNWMTEEELASYIYSVTREEFAEQWNCRYSKALEIMKDVRINQLNRNPFASAGFEVLAFQTDDLREYIRNSRANPVPSLSDEVDVILYDKIMHLYMAYKKSFDIHSEILNGTTPVPDYVDSNDVPGFLALIRNRFDFGWRNLTDEDKKFISNATYQEVAEKYLFRYKKIRNLKARIKRGD